MSDNYVSLNGYSEKLNLNKTHTEMLTPACQTTYPNQIARLYQENLVTNLYLSHHQKFYLNKILTDNKCLKKKQ